MHVETARQQSWAVQSRPNQPEQLLGPTSNLCRKTAQMYSIASVPGATSIHGQRLQGATITNNHGTSIKVTFEAAL